MERRTAGAAVAGVLAIACLALGAGSAGAATAVHRIADLNPGAKGSYPSQFTAFNGQIYFAANRGGSGRELWRTNGNNASMVADIAPAGSSDPAELTVFGGALLFTADDGSHGREIWRYDGVHPPSMVADLATLPPGESSHPADLTPAGGTLFFHAAANPVMGDELWKYDGVNPPVMLAPTPGGVSAIGGSDPTELLAIGGEVYFWANDQMHATELWKSNGTDAGTVMVADTNPGFSDPPDFHPLGQEGLPMGSVGGKLFFDADDGTHGPELWTYDGTNPPAMVNGGAGGINPGAGGSSPGGITDFNGTALFNANDGSHGLELWKSPPPYTGAVMVADINPGLSSYPDRFTVVNDKVFFTAQNGIHGIEVWRTDGGSAIEINAASGGIRPGFFGSGPSNLVPFGGGVLLEANDGNGFELWQTDATVASKVAQINPNGGSYPNALANIGGVVYFAADDGKTGSELWATGVGRGGKKKCKHRAKGRGHHKAKAKSAKKHPKKHKKCRRKKKHRKR